MPAVCLTPRWFRAGYLACAKCGGMGAIMNPGEREQLKEQLITAGKAGGASRQVALKKLRAERCNNCSGAGKVGPRNQSDSCWQALSQWV